MFGNREIPSISEMDNAQREIDLIKGSLESFIEECSIFNSSIDDSTTRSELLQTQLNEIDVRFDDIYHLLKMIPNALVAYKLQLSMETLLEKAKRVFMFEVMPTVQRVQDIKKLNFHRSIILPDHFSGYSKPVAETKKTRDDRGFEHHNLILDVPVFSGDISEFPAFKDSFDRTFHNTDLPNSFKLSALKSRLSGQLLITISKFNEDYNKAYASLVQQYSVTQVKAQEKLDAFLLIPGLLRISSEEIERYRTSIAEAHQDLIKLNLPDLADYILYFFAYNRVPDVLKEEFLETVKPGDIPTLQQLLDFLSNWESSLKNSEKLDTPVPALVCDDLKKEDLTTSKRCGSNSDGDDGAAASLSLLKREPWYLYEEPYSIYTSGTFLAVDKEVSSATECEYPISGVLPFIGAGQTEPKPALPGDGDSKIVDRSTSSVSNQKPGNVHGGPHSMSDCSKSNDTQDLSLSAPDRHGIQQPVLPNAATCKRGSKLRRSGSGDNMSANGSSSSESVQQPCHVCSGPHSMRNCPAFRGFSVEERRSYMETFSHICRSCLTQRHLTSNCKSLASCRLCLKRHHILLHPPPQSNKRSDGQETSQDRENTLREIKKAIRMFSCTKSPSPASSTDGAFFSDPSSDSKEYVYTPQPIRHVD